MKVNLWVNIVESPYYTVHLDQRGRLVLPSEIRRRLKLKQGDTLILAIEADGAIRLITPKEAARRSRGILRRLAPSSAGRCLSEELIRDRREEASHE